MTLPARLGLAFALLAPPALAHHPLGGATPASFTDGFLSGIGHPMLGIDHFAFIAAMGLIAAMSGRLFVAPVAFLLAAGAGVLLTAAGVALPFTEIAVAGTATLAGALVLARRVPGLAASLALFAVAGLFHGLAFGEAIVGAETTPLVAYLAGLGLTQYGIAVAAGLVAMKLWGETGAGAVETRLAGAVAAGVGGTFLIEALEALAFGPLA
jgi:urease accessory protein